MGGVKASPLTCPFLGELGSRCGEMPLSASVVRIRAPPFLVCPSTPDIHKGGGPLGEPPTDWTPDPALFQDPFPILFPAHLMESWGRIEKQVRLLPSHVLAVHLVRFQCYPDVVSLLWLVLGWGSYFLSWKDTLTNNDQADGERKQQTQKVIP